MEQKPKIAVFGDFIIDKYITLFKSGEAREASGTHKYNELLTKQYLGGAGHTATAIKYLDGIVTLFTTFDTLENVYIPFSVKNVFPNTYTNTITRFVDCENKQLFRIDNCKYTNTILDYTDIIQQIVEQHDAIIISDYNYGIVNKAFFDTLVSYLKNINKQFSIYIDSKEFDFIPDDMSFIDTISPNEDELRNLADDYKTSILILAVEFMSQRKLKQILLKQGENGCALITNTDITKQEVKVNKYKYKTYNLNEYTIIKSNYGEKQTVPIKDTIGAGDCTIAAFVMARQSGYALADCVVQADVAGWLNATHSFTFSPNKFEIEKLIYT